MRGAPLNPIAPYRWEARYELGRLLQYDVDGWHTSREIDRARLRGLLLHGHPSGPLALSLPAVLAAPPDEVLVRATTDLHATVEAGTGARMLETVRWIFLGVRYGPRVWALQLDAAGHVLALDGHPLPVGGVLNPLPCSRCNGKGVV